MTVASAGMYHNTKVYSIVPSSTHPENHMYWLGLLNSKVMWWFLSNTGYVLRGGYFVFKTNYLSPFPIRPVDFSDPADKARHDRMVNLVQRMLDLHQQLQAANSEAAKQRLQREIAATDEKIDKLVYELYGLTDEEIRIVEGR